MKQLALVGALLLCVRGAAAQAPPPPPVSTGIPVDRFVPALGPTALFGSEGADVTPYGHLSWVLSLSYQRDPLNIATALQGATVTRPVDAQLVTDVAFELGLWQRRLAFAMGLPVVLQQSGERLSGLGADVTPLRSGVGGDFRMRLKLALIGDPDRPGLHLATLLQLTLPFGGERDFAATDGATILPALLADVRVGRMIVTGQVGARFARERQLFATKFGDQLEWSAGAGVAILIGRGFALDGVAELAGAVGPSPGSRPAEFRGGLRGSFRGLMLDLGAGAGLDSDVGAPAWRVFGILRQRLSLLGG